MGRFNRFLHLERERAPEGESTGEAERARASRFDAVQTEEASAHGTGSAQGHLARFEHRAPHESPLEHEKEEVDQPFLRCARCEGDSHRRAPKCQHCLAELDTPEQRAFNEAHWKAIVEHREAQKELLRATRRTVEDDEARLKKALTDGSKSPIEKLIEERLGEDWKPLSVKLGPVEIPLRVLLACTVLGAIASAVASRGCGQ